jgi:hypothetical protein
VNTAGPALDTLSVEALDGLLEGVHRRMVTLTESPARRGWEESRLRPPL